VQAQKRTQRFIKQDNLIYFNGDLLNMAGIEEIILADQYMIVLGVTLLFSVLAIARRTVILEIISTICWWISAVVNLFASPTQLYVLTFLWMGLGFVFLSLFFADIWQLFIIRKRNRWDETL